MPGKQPGTDDDAADRQPGPDPLLRHRPLRALQDRPDRARVARVGTGPDPEDLEPEVAALLDERAAARAARDFGASDRLRDELATHGVTVEDTRDGQRWRRSVEAGHG